MNDLCSNALSPLPLRVRKAILSGDYKGEQHTPAPKSEGRLEPDRQHAKAIPSWRNNEKVLYTIKEVFLCANRKE